MNRVITALQRVLERCQNLLHPALCNDNGATVVTWFQSSLR